MKEESPQTGYNIGRRQLLKTISVSTPQITLAGCITNENAPSEEQTRPTQTEQDNHTDRNDPKEPEQEDEKKSETTNQVDFTWEDIRQKELETLQIRAWEGVDPEPIRNSDMTNYNEFQDALITTMNDGIHRQANEHGQIASSALTSSVSAGINLILYEELKNYDSLDVMIQSFGNDGHGYAHAISTDHPITLVDSNTPNIGPAIEEPLNNRNDGSQMTDPVGNFKGKEFHEADRHHRPKLARLFTAIYQIRGDAGSKTGIPSDKVDVFYEEAVFGDGSLLLGPVKDTASVAEYKIDENLFDRDYAGITIDSKPSKLPVRSEYDSIGAFVSEVEENHLRFHKTESEYLDDLTI